MVAIVAPSGKYQDLSTTTICRTSLMADHPWEEPITDQLIEELRTYVRSILSQYQDVPYHNFEHGYHVVISSNKLLDLMLNWEIHQHAKKPPNLFGLRNDPLMHFLLIFCALIHDVEHKGIPNRQLAMEDDELAILYNDQSIAENRSLAIGFTELLKDEYATLRAAIFKSDEEYRRFRKMCVDIVLVTDIASPERTQIRKSKWKEAFGEEFDTMERKVKHELKRQASGVSGAPAPPPVRAGRRVSATMIINQLKNQEVNDGGEEDSPSNTPENSDTEDDGKHLDDSVYGDVSESSKGDSSQGVAVPGVGYAVINNPGHRSASMPFVANPNDNEIRQALGYSDNHVRKFQRRMSTSACVPGRHRVRLGISRSIDLSGEFIENYRRRSTVGGAGGSGGSNAGAGNKQEEEEEEVDELKTSVIFETIITAADVGHNLQGWTQMCKWSDRLYLELQRANSQGRGFDPKGNWHGGQIGFLESYLLPLARKLEDMGVFGDVIGPVFAKIVESNRDTWVAKGQPVVDNIIAKGAELYPATEKSE